MAKQNFLAGGFYGKLGNTVGQRWKNKRTIRTYVIPENPKTPAQMANRSKFTLATSAAQKAMSMNYRSPAFQSETNTEWALRMSTAKYAADAGQTDVGLIPVVPRGFTSDYQITGVSVQTIISQRFATFLFEGNVYAPDRHYSMMLYFVDGPRAGQYMLVQGTSDNNNPRLLQAVCDDTSGIVGYTVNAIIVSYDDETPETITYSGKLTVASESKPGFQQTFTINSVAPDGQGGYLISGQMGVYGADLVGTFGARDPYVAGTRKMKAEVADLGSESAATAINMSGDDWEILNPNFNTVTGAFSIYLRNTQYEDIQLYNITAISIQFYWQNAYNADTSMNSGWQYVQPATMPEPYTQDAIAMTITPDFEQPVAYFEDGASATSFRIDQMFTVTPASVAALIGEQEGSYPCRVASGSGQLTVTGTNGQTRTAEVQESGAEVIINSDGSIELDNVNATYSPALGADPASVRTTTLVLRAAKNATFGRWVGIYDNSHRWTSIGGLNVSGDYEVELD